MYIIERERNVGLNRLYFIFCSFSGHHIGLGLGLDHRDSGLSCLFHIYLYLCRLFCPVARIGHLCLDTGHFQKAVARVRVLVPHHGSHVVHRADCAAFALQCAAEQML